MTQYLVKVAVTTLVIVLAAELAKRSTWAGALLIALPLTSVMAMSWLYHDTRDVQQVAALSRSIFWLVLPTLTFFLAFPWAVERGWGFWRGLAFACAVGAASYGMLALGKLSLTGNQ
jgi:hypothetical protein